MTPAESVCKAFRLFSSSAGLDAQVLSTLLFRSWTVLAGGAMVLFIPIFLDKVEQGYYYTFSSLIALQIFFELGMGQVVVQLVSHDFAHVGIGDDQTVLGDQTRMARLASFVGLLHRWYGIAALLFFVAVGAGGIFFFSSQGALPFSVWGGAWLLTTLATSLNLYLSFKLTVLEGCGQVSGVARMRLVQSVIGYSMLWVALGLGAGLWAIPLVPLVAAGYSTLWLQANDQPINRIRGYLLGKTNFIKYQWRKDIFPFQWRIAVSWISGYFIFQLFTPLAFSKFGAIEAGRLGISLAVFSALLTVGMSWINAKVPAMAAHVSRNERSMLNALFVGLLNRAMAFTLIATLVIVVVVLLFTKFGLGIADRFSSLPVIFCLAVITLVNCFVFGAAAYMRAHKEEPMMWVSLVSGVATLAVTAIGSEFSVLAMMFGYALVCVFISLPWTAFLFMKYFRKTA